MGRIFPWSRLLISDGRSCLRAYLRSHGMLLWAHGVDVTCPTSLTLSYSPICNQKVPQEIPFFIRNQYSVIASKKSKTTAIISRIKIKKYIFSESLLNALPIRV